MLLASVELSKAMKELVDLREFLGELDKVNVCDLDEESRAQASIRLLKAYELCVRIDEALRTAMTHKEQNEIESELDRAKALLETLFEHIKIFNDREKRILLVYLQPDFDNYQAQLTNVLSKTRASEKIWEAEKLISVISDLSHAVESLRKSIGRALLVVSTSSAGDTSGHFGNLVC